MYVRIHQAGQQHQVAELMLQGGPRHVSGLVHRLDASLLNHDCCRPHTLGGNYAAGDKCLCHTSDIRATPWESASAK